MDDMMDSDAPFSKYSLQDEFYADPFYTQKKKELEKEKEKKTLSDFFFFPDSEQK